MGGRYAGIARFPLPAEAIMSETETIQIKLAGQTYIVPAFTVGQLADLHIASNEPQLDINTKEGAKAFWARNIAILAVAFADGSPGITPEEVSKKKLGNLKEVNDAVTEIMVFSGIWKRKEEIASGESQAAA
jgi:hypothetical protein